jgi:hypothetical protein
MVIRDPRVVPVIHSYKNYWSCYYHQGFVMIILVKKDIVVLWIIMLIRVIIINLNKPINPIS